MSGRRPHGRAIVDPNWPQAFAVCDRCGAWENHVNLRYQYIIAGPQYINSNFLVCDRCWDEPALFLQPITLPPDPVPIRDPRIENFAVDEVDYLTESNTDNHINTNTDLPIVTDQPSQNFDETP